jgi:hypothetical protein
MGRRVKESEGEGVVGFPKICTKKRLYYILADVTWEGIYMPYLLVDILKNFDKTRVWKVL